MVAAADCAARRRRGASAAIKLLIAGAGASAAIEAGVCVLRALRMSEAVPRGPHHAQSERRRPAPPTLGRNTCCDFMGEAKGI